MIVGDELVAHAGHRLQQPAVLVAQLLAQAANVKEAGALAAAHRAPKALGL